MRITLRLNFIGNATTHRGLWSVLSYASFFRDNEELDVRIETDIARNMIQIFCSECDLSMVLDGFKNHIKRKIINNLGAYRLTNVAVFVSKLAPKSYRFLVISEYGHREIYYIYVLAPSLVQENVSVCDILFEQIKHTTSWEVNSITSIGCVPNGIRFLAREEDAVLLAKELGDYFELYLIDLLENVEHDFIDVEVQHSHIGRRLYIKLGLESLYEKTDWRNNDDFLQLISSSKTMRTKPEDRCAICLRDFEQNSFLQTECGHFFHGDCMQNLHVLTTPFKCPICRASIKSLISIDVLRKRKRK